jgi:hypothetical protein
MLGYLCDQTLKKLRTSYFRVKECLSGTVCLKLFIFLLNVLDDFLDCFQVVLPVGTEKSAVGTDSCSVTQTDYL